MKFSKWHIAPAEEADIRRLGEAGYPQLVSQVLAARGISTAEEAAAFLERGRDLTCSPFLMKDMDRAVECISRAIRQGRRMAVFGDYDVDGITATVILVDYLKSRGVDVLHYIPRRIEDGYGLGQDAIRSLHEQACVRTCASCVSSSAPVRSVSVPNLCPFSPIAEKSPLIGCKFSLKCVILQPEIKNVKIG